mgnify:CR=1 FL=1
MKVFKTQKEIEAGIKNDVLEITGNVRFECSLDINASILIKATDLETGNIDAMDITAWNIKAWNINARDIKAGNINARNIDARNIKAWDIKAENIDAGNINAGDINARDINAGNIVYYAFCCVYKSIRCFSIVATHVKSHPPICLDGEVEIQKKATEENK